jgi:hypothetical protein
MPVAWRAAHGQSLDEFIAKSAGHEMLIAA